MIYTMRNLIRRAAILLALAFALGVSAQPAAAAFDPQKDIGKRTSIRLKEIADLRDFLKIARVPPFGDLELTNLRAGERAFTGDVTLWKSKWTIVVFSADDTIFITFAPKGPFAWRRVLRNLTGGPAFDLLAFDRQLLAFSLEDASIPSANLPPLAQETFAPYFADKTYTVTFATGLSHFGVLDPAKVPLLQEALAFIGGSSQLLRTRGAMTAGGLGDFFRDGPQATVKLAAPLAPFAATIGGKIRWPSDAGFTFRVESSADSARFGFFSEGPIEFVHPNVVRSRPVTTVTNAVLASAIVAPDERAKPQLGVTATLFLDRSWRPALGFPGLDIDQYVVAFTPTAAGVKVAANGTGRFARRDVKLSGTTEITAPTSGIPVPKTMRLEVDEGPDVPGAFALNDLATLLREVSIATGGEDIAFSPIIREFADVRGAKPGEGAAIEIDTQTGIRSGFGVAGVLAVNNKEVGPVSKATLKPDEGIDIESHGGRLSLGSAISFTTTNVRVLWSKDAPADPSVTISGGVEDVLGWSGNLELKLTKDAQFASTDKTNLFGLFDSSLIIEGNGTNLKAPEFKVLAVIRGDYFNRVADGLVAAVWDATLSYSSLVASLNEEAHALQRMLIQLKLDRDRAMTRPDETAAYWRGESGRAGKEVERMSKLYAALGQACGNEPEAWESCIEADATWNRLRGAKSVLAMANRIADTVSQPGQRLQAASEAYISLIKDVGTKFDIVARTVGETAKRAGGLLNFAAKIPAGGLRANPGAFEITRLYLKGDLSSLQAQRRGVLGIEFNALGKTYYRDTPWDYRLTPEKILEVAKPGPEPTGQETSYQAKYSFSAFAQAAMQGILSNVALSPQGLPFDPGVCERYPYPLDRQIARTQAELEALQSVWWPKQARYVVQGADKTPDFLAVKDTVSKITAGASGDPAARQQANADLTARGQKYRVDPSVYVQLVAAYRKAKDQAERSPGTGGTATSNQAALEFLNALRALQIDPLNRDLSAAIATVIQDERTKAEADAASTAARSRATESPDSALPIEAVRDAIRATAQSDIAGNMLFQDLRYLQVREAELADLGTKLEKVKDQPASVCGQAIQDAKITGGSMADMAVAGAKALAASRAAANENAIKEMMRAAASKTGQRGAVTATSHASTMGIVPLIPAGSGEQPSAIDLQRTEILERPVERVSKFRSAAPTDSAGAPLFAWISGAIVENAKLVPR